MNVLCQRCGKEFKVTPYQFNKGRGKYCSLKCKNKEKVKVNCFSCGKELYRWPSIFKRSTQFFCNNQCHANLTKGVILKTVLCAICGKEIHRKSSHLSPNNYCSRKCFSKWQSTIKGKNTSNWKGGTYKIRGYIMTYCPDHPNHNNRGYVAEHRLIAEKAIGKFLPQKSVVHHVNGNKSDNRNKNLIICENDSYHHLLHQRQEHERRCLNGNSIEARC